MTDLTTTLWVAGGGAAGAYLRFQITVWFSRWFGQGFPYATLFVNVAGSFLIGLLAGAVTSGVMPAVPWHSEGFLGALTTFSTFSMDTFKAFHTGEPGKASLNILLNLTLCVCGTALGFALVTN